MWPGYVGGCSGSSQCTRGGGSVGMGGLSRLRVPSHPHWACQEKPSSDTAGGEAIASPPYQQAGDSAGPATQEPGPGRSAPRPPALLALSPQVFGSRWQLQSRMVVTLSQGTQARCFLSHSDGQVMLRGRVHVSQESELNSCPK